MIRAIIIEDESLTATRLEKMVAKIDQCIQIVAVLQTVKETVEWIRSNREPDLYFMDIQLSDGLSFDIFDAVEICKPVIFTTAYDEYAIKAFKANGIDYLLKPIVQRELEITLQRFNRYKVTPAADDLRELLKKISVQEKIYKSNFLIEWRDQLLSIAASDIAYFWLSNKIVNFKTHDKKIHTLTVSLDLLESELDPKFFFRINRQMIISRTSIREIHIYFGNRLKLNLQPQFEEEIIVSRERVNEFKLWLDK